MVTIRWSPKSLQFIMWGSVMSVQNVLAIHPTVFGTFHSHPLHILWEPWISVPRFVEIQTTCEAIFQSGPVWWTNRLPNRLTGIATLLLIFSSCLLVQSFSCGCMMTNRRSAFDEKFSTVTSFPLPLTAFLSLVHKHKIWNHPSHWPVTSITIHKCIRALPVHKTPSWFINVFIWKS